jgi:hypothetical protein
MTLKETSPPESCDLKKKEQKGFSVIPHSGEIHGMC